MRRIQLLSLVCALVALPLMVTSAQAAQPSAEDKATKDDYELDTSGTDTKIKAGADGKFSLVVKPKNGKKVHPDAPFEVTFKDPKGVRPAKNKLGRADVVDKAAKAPEVQTKLKGDKAGDATLEASVSFFLCTDAWCQRMTDRVSVAITIE
jgi:hypothetical protein